MKKIILFGLILFYSNFYSQGFANGNLKEENRIKLIEELSSLSGIKIGKTDTVILNFYIRPETEPNGSCIDYYTNDSSYKRFVKKNKNIVQFFITEKMYSYKHGKVIEDKNDEIKKLIFQNAKLCGNYAIIKPNGEFIRKYGEYRQDEIPKLVLQ